MVRSIGAVAVPLLLVFFLLAPGVLATGCTSSPRGSILIPSGTSAPPPFSWPNVMNGLMTYRVNAGAYQDTPFVLSALGGQPPGSDCTVPPVPCVVIPDFNVCWYEEDGGFGRRIACDTQEGAIEGDIPPGTDYALVYMPRGPDAEPTFGAEFVLGLGC